MGSYNIFLPSYSVGVDVFTQVKGICSKYGKTITVIVGKTALEKVKDEMKSTIGSCMEILDFVYSRIKKQSMYSNFVHALLYLNYITFYAYYEYFDDAFMAS